MTTVELFPADIYNQKTIRQGHPPDWINRDGGEYGLVVLGGGPAGLVSAVTAGAQGHRVAMTEQRLTGGTCVAANPSSSPSMKARSTLARSSR
jgi:heterodisulfide reductase subunit A-like polyferredoxin